MKTHDSITLTFKGKDFTPDLAPEIVRALARRPGDQIRCTRIAGQAYRCNWYAADTGRDAGRGGIALVPTYRIRDSRFLRVTKRGEQLLIEESTGTTARAG